MAYVFQCWQWPPLTLLQPPTNYAAKPNKKKKEHSPKKNTNKFLKNDFFLGNKDFPWWTTLWGSFCPTPRPQTNCLQGKMQIKWQRQLNLTHFQCEKKCLTFCGYFMWKMYCITTTKAEKREKLEGTRKKKNKEKGSFNYLAPACVSI